MFVHEISTVLVSNAQEQRHEEAARSYSGKLDLAVSLVLTAFRRQARRLTG